MSDKKQQQVNVVDKQGLAVLLNGISSKNRTQTLMDSVSDSKNKIEDVITKSKALVVDSFGNSLTASGNKDKVKLFNEYGFSNNTLNFSLWSALYNDSWIFRRVIDKPSQDIVKLGVNINLTDVNKKHDVEAIVRKHASDFTNLLKWGRLYGGSIAIVMFDTFEDADYTKPIKENQDKLMSAKSIRMYVTDRWYGLSYDTLNTVQDMNSIDYGKPNQYTITFANGQSLTVHHDYVLRYEHRNAPNFIKNGQLMGWGYAEGAHLLNELSRDDELKASITSLINKCLIEVIKMDGMRGVFMGNDSESENQLKQRLEMVNWARSFNSLTFLDSNDEYQMNGFNGLGGLSDLLEKNMWLVSAACEMQGVLYGDLTQGFSHDSEALERYDDTIQTTANSLFRPCMEKFLHIIYTKLGITEKVDFEFGSLLTDLHNSKKNEAISKHIDMLSKLLSDGAITLTQYNKSLKDFCDKDVVDFHITDDTIKEVEEKAKEESEGLDLNV